MKCEKCGSKMKESGRETIMAELNDDATEGQIADHLAAQESGDFGDWSITEITYKCKKCNNQTVTQQG